MLAAAGKDAVVVSAGNGRGFKNRHPLNLYETIDTRNEQGAAVFTEERPVVEITLKSGVEFHSRMQR